VPGEGSCFWFSARFDRVLPDALVVSDTTPGVLAIDGCVQPLDPALGERLRGARVLLAEDNPVNRQLACELLGAAGVEVDVAQNGLEAVRRGRTRAYDLVLMDLQMPVMDGLAATRELRGQPQHARTPILAMTAEGFGVDWQACQAAGMDDHLTKPVEPDLLYAMLGRWLPPRATRATRGQAAAAATPAPAAPAADPARPAPADLPPVPATPEAEATPAPDFSDIPGLTMARALLYLPGRDQVYARVLRQFSDSYRGGLQALLPALRSGQWADAKRQLHALRGACGAVGAVALMAQCQAVEQQLAALAEANGSIRSAEGLTAEAQAIDHQLARLIAAVDERFSGAAPAAPAPAETLGADGLARLTEAMDRLAAMLQVADFGAAGEFRALEPALCAGLGEDAARSLERALRAHDYDAALQALQVLRARLASSPAQ
jgi:CheY-like chemotaxis protein